LENFTEAEDVALLIDSTDAPHVFFGTACDQVMDAQPTTGTTVPVPLLRGCQANNAIQLALGSDGLVYAVTMDETGALISFDPTKE
jgi:hypothetical protein